MISYTLKTAADIQSALNWAAGNIAKGLAAGAVVITLGREQRTNEQNSKMWPMLNDISSQVEYMGKKWSPEAWKDLITALWKKQEIVAGLDGGIVALGVSTSKLNKAQFSELIECIYSVGAERGVVWSEPALAIYEQYKEAK